jgi:hypothetical protein
MTLGGRRGRAWALLGVVLGVAGCAEGPSENTKKAVENVVTLRFGTVSDLHELVGTGPFLDLPLAPARMLPLVTAILRTKVPAVFENERTMTVIAKERRGPDAWVDDYSPEWVSAVLVAIFPVEGRPDACRVEIHATNRGAFAKGSIAWERDLPPLFEEAARHPDKRPIRPLGR